MLKRLIDKTRSLLGGETDSPQDDVTPREDASRDGFAVPRAPDPEHEVFSTPTVPAPARADADDAAAAERDDARKGGGRRRSGKRERADGPAGGQAAARPKALPGNPRIVPREDHPVSRKAMSRSALKVLDRLHEGGFGGFLVGGGVRDALVGIDPKDFDIATDASPEEVRALFRNSRIIGRRFRLVHVVFGREIIEVATFRAAHDQGEGGEVGASGRIVRDNVFGSIAEDAERRDFSVNALYYNIADRSVIDYVGGLEDIEAKVFRLIGDPLTRCEEDPVRVLRAVRLSAKLGFSIEETTGAAMKRVAPELGKTPPARLFEEVLKLFQGGYAERSFAAVVEHDLLRYLFPMLERRLGEGDDAGLRRMLDAALANTDRRVSQGKPITPSYLLAFMLWPDVEERARADCAAGVPVHEALREAADRVVAKQLAVISIPRRFSGPMKEIWQMQPRLERNRGRRALSLMEDRRFRAAYDFLCLRARIDERLAPSAEWWTAVQEMDEEAREAAAAAREIASGIWGDGAAGEAAELPPVVSEDDAPRRDGAEGGRRRRRGGRRRGGAGEGDREGTGRTDGPGGEGDPDAADASSAVASGTAPAAGTSAPAKAPVADGAVDRAAGPAAGGNGGASGDGTTDDGAPKKKRRRRRRRPGGDRARQPGGDG